MDKLSHKLMAQNITEIYNQGKKNEVTAIKDVDVAIDENEFVCLVGPSGCGKSTLLRMFAGLDFPSYGKLIIDNEEIIGPGADRGMVFQTYTLFPWMNVEENIKFGTKLKKMPKSEQQEIADRYLETIGLTKFRKSLPKELSGGMKQRVAIARALANKPKVLLMDEPFGALDLFTKSQMQLMMRDIWQKERTTVVFITHDIEEAVFLGTKIYVMSAAPGEIREIIDVNLPEERDLDLKDTSEFIKLRRYINSILH